MFTDVSGILWYVLLLFVCVYKWVVISVASFCFWLCVCLHKFAHDMQVPEVSFWKSERCRDNEPVADAGCEGES